MYGGELAVRRLLVPVGLFLVIAALGLLFLPRDTYNPQRVTQRGSSMMQMENQVKAQAAAVITTHWEGNAYAIPDDPELETDSKAPPLCEGSSLSTPRQVVDVPVATLWSQPNQARAMDHPALQNPAPIKSWLRTMSIPDKLWLVGKLETQVLLGTEVAVLGEQGDWVQVTVPDQATPKNENGYPGWVPKVQIAERTIAYDACPVAVVSKPTAWLYEDAVSDRSTEEISFNTKLPVLTAEGSRVGAAVREGEIRWIEKADVKIMEPSMPADQLTLQVTGGELVNTAQGFLDLPYLWSGTSGFGFDCSGFTYAIHQFHGIDIPRDAKDQARQGTAVALADIEPGDLLFYAYDKGKGKVHHVAMYIGDGKMIHSPRTERSIEIISIHTPSYAQEFAGACRYTAISI